MFSSPKPPELALGPILDHLAEAMRQKLDLNGATPGDVYPKARRLLPRRYRRDIDYLMETVLQSQHPKLVRQVDMARVTRISSDLTGYLKRVDKRKMAEFRMLGTLTVIMVNLAILFVLVIGFAIWRGLI